MKKETTLSYYGRVRDGKIELPKKRFQKEVVSAFEGHGIEVIVKRKRKQRSTPQNSYYWGVVVPMILDAFIDLGNDLQSGNKQHIQMIHDFLKERFLDNGPDLVDANAEQCKGPSSTTYCTTVDFMEYLDRVAQWAAEALNIAIPEPSELSTQGCILIR